MVKRPGEQSCLLRALPVFLSWRAGVFSPPRWPPKVTFGVLDQQAWPKDIPKFQPGGEIQGQAAPEPRAAPAG